MTCSDPAMGVASRKTKLQKLRNHTCASNGTGSIVKTMQSMVRMLAVAVVAALTGCTLSSDVDVMPVSVYPVEIERSSDIYAMAERGDYARGAALGPMIDAKGKTSVRELMAVGRCEAASGRLDAARAHFRRALDLHPRGADYAEVAWELSKVEYMANNYAAAEEWARTAEAYGVRVRKWHIEYLNSLSGIQVNRIRAMASSRIPMTFGKPDIPRITTYVNGDHPVRSVVDSGAVISIISASLASTLNVRSLGDFEGEFIGLLGEPIPVRFGLLDSIRIGEIEVGNVPVAIMPDKSLNFFVYNREPFNMEFLIGTNLLREFRLELNFRRETMTFTTLTPEMRNPDPEQNLFLCDFRPFVHTHVNRKGWYLFVVDTGSEITFLNEESADLTRLRSARRMHGATLQGLGGAQKRGDKIENVQVGIDKWVGTFKDIPLYSSERGAALGIIGQNFMKNFRVVIDFGSMRMDLYRDRMLAFSADEYEFPPPSQGRTPRH